MSSIRKVSVLRASGALGQYVVPALLKAGFNVTIISRPNGRGYTPSHSAITTIEAAYDDFSQLTTALQDQDALIEIFNPAGTIHQRTIVRAALAAGIKHLITNEFGLDTFHPNIHSLPSAQGKIKAQRELEDELQSATAAAAADVEKPVTLSWTGIFSGIWYDWAILEKKFWINPTTRSITRFGSGEQKISISRAALNGEAVVAVLKEPGRFSNRPAYFASHTVTTDELIGVVEEVSGERWRIDDVPDVEGFRREAIRLWDEDTERGVEDRLKSEAFSMLSTAAAFDERNYFGFDYGGKLEPGWDEGEEELKVQLKRLFHKITDQEVC